MKAAVYTLGCKVNQTESECISELLEKNGYEIVTADVEADYYIINSCTVTSVSDKKTRQCVRKFKRLHPYSTVILIGCFPQAFPEIAASLMEADIITGNKDCSNILKLIKKYEKDGKRLIDIEQHIPNEKFSHCSIDKFKDRIRAFVKIEDGCDRFCTYCIIPYSRGRVRSKSLESLKYEIQNLASNSIKEIVLDGINLSAYGKGENFDLGDAVRICNDTDGILRVRLGSLEPDMIDDSLLDKLANCDKFCPQFHLALQSGDNNTLKKMNRHYTTEEYKTLVERIRNKFKHSAITTDIMVGFNGETDENFNNCLNFVKKIGFEKVHIFPYSFRSGTAAVNIDGRVDSKIKDDRVAKMKIVADKSRMVYLQSLVGTTQKVLFESFENQSYRGYTKCYAPVTVQSNINLIGKELDVTIEKINDESCFGILL